MRLFEGPVDTRTYFNVYAASYRRWNDIVCSPESLFKEIQFIIGALDENGLGCVINLNFCFKMSLLFLVNDNFHFHHWFFTAKIFDKHTCTILRLEWDYVELYQLLSEFMISLIKKKELPSSKSSSCLTVFQVFSFRSLSLCLIFPSS